MADDNITAPAATAEDNLAAETLAKLQALPDVKRLTCLNYKLFVRKQISVALDRISQFHIQVILHYSQYSM